MALGLGAAAAAILSADPAEAAVRMLPDRKLALYNIHTGESLKTTYWSGGKYVPSSLSSVARLLRDHRNNKVHNIDPRLLDVMAAVHRKIGGKGALHVVCGYRSPETNAWLAAHSDGVAGQSLHMQGKAVDIRVPGHSPRLIGRAAKSLRLGGVGTYASSDFVHVDTGKVRYW